jgi:hypothetical protein
MPAPNMLLSIASQQSISCLDSGLVRALYNEMAAITANAVPVIKKNITHAYTPFLLMFQSSLLSGSTNSKLFFWCKDNTIFENQPKDLC